MTVTQLMSCMGKMMTRQHGEYIPCDPERECRLRETVGCFEDIDHLASPDRAYRTKLERQFKNHILNKVLTCRDLHNERHATEGHREKPSVRQMRQFLEENP